MNCWQCATPIDVFAEKDEQIYCGSCGAYNGTGEILEKIQEITSSRQSEWSKFTSIFNLPRCMWFDEFLHTFTTWHITKSWVRKHCDWVQTKLESSL